MSTDVKTAAVISTFNPPADLSDKVTNLLTEVDLVVVVDDGSPGDPTSALGRASSAGAHILRLEKNSGIAAALNAGIRHADQIISPEWFVTLDQDSELDPGYVSAALSTAAGAKASNIDVGFVCPESVNGEPVLILDPGAPFPESFDPMQSGSVIPASVFDRAGLLDESLFIDAVDSDFTARIRTLGMRAIIGQGCNLRHAVGESRPMKLFGWHVSLRGKKTYIYYHAPFRVYYIARNGVVLVKRYVRADPRWVFRRLYSESITHAVRFIFGPHRAKHLIAFVSGVRDGLRGRLGKIDRELAQKLKV